MRRCSAPNKNVGPIRVNMLLSPPQQRRFWREWTQACAAQGWTRAASWTGAQIDANRKRLLKTAGFDSLTQVTPLEGFTAVLRELAILRNDLSGLVRAEQNPRRVLIHAIKALADEPYWQAIARDRFHTTDLADLDESQLIQLRNTLTARHKPPRPNRPQSSESIGQSGTDLQAAQATPARSDNIPF